jgi:hypothetical protein
MPAGTGLRAVLVRSWGAVRAHVAQATVLSSPLARWLSRRRSCSGPCARPVRTDLDAAS